MPAEAVEGAGVRVGLRTLGSLALCAGAAAAALAHFVIDVVGDYALARDSYDHLRHGSRELVTGVALIVAAMLAARGLRICCEIASAHRTRLLRPVFALRETVSMFAGAIVAAAMTVPIMEYADGLVDGVPVHRLVDAFGGSIALGFFTALICALAVTFGVYSFARWLIAHRDSIVSIIETLLCRRTAGDRPSGFELFAQLVTARRRRAPEALRLSKRGPPVVRFVPA